MCPYCGSKDVTMSIGILHEFGHCNVCNIRWTQPVVPAPRREDADARPQKDIAGETTPLIE